MTKLLTLQSIPSYIIAGEVQVKVFANSEITAFNKVILFNGKYLKNCTIQRKI